MDEQFHIISEGSIFRVFYRKSTLKTDFKLQENWNRPSVASGFSRKLVHECARDGFNWTDVLWKKNDQKLALKISLNLSKDISRNKDPFFHEKKIVSVRKHCMKAMTATMQWRVLIWSRKREFPTIYIFFRAFWPQKHLKDNFRNLACLMKIYMLKGTNWGKKNGMKIRNRKK